MNQTQLKKIIKRLSAHYYTSIAILAILFILILLKVVRLSGNPEFVTQTMELYAIGITLIAIPASLKGFAYLIRKEKRQDSDAIIRNYKKAFFIRLYVLFIITLMNEIFFSISRNMNFFWLALILFFAFLFCSPSLSELMELHPQKVKNENKKV